MLKYCTEDLTLILDTRVLTPRLLIDSTPLALFVRLRVQQQILGGIENEEFSIVISHSFCICPRQSCYGPVRSN